jgi:hypothetical protein
MMESNVTIENVVFNALVMIGTLIEKNKKYADAWKEFGIFGVLQHNWTKTKRLKGQLWDDEKQEWKAKAKELLSDIGDEGCVYDTNKDIVGYGLLAMGLFDKQDESVEVALRGLNRLFELMNISVE